MNDHDHEWPYYRLSSGVCGYCDDVHPECRLCVSYGPNHESQCDFSTGTPIELVAAS